MPSTTLYPGCPCCGSQAPFVTTCGYCTPPGIPTTLYVTFTGGPCIPSGSFPLVFGGGGGSIWDTGATPNIPFPAGGSCAANIFGRVTMQCCASFPCVTFSLGNQPSGGTCTGFSIPVTLFVPASCTPFVLNCSFTLSPANTFLVNCTDRSSNTYAFTISP